MVKFPIHHHLNQLEEMLTSLQLKWSRVNRETPTPRSLSSGGSRLTNWFENVSEVLAIGVRVLSYITTLL